MASSYTGLGTELMTTGENAGTWGSTTNTNLQIIEQMVGGYVEQAVTTTTTLSVSDGSTGATLSHRIIKFTGTMSANSTVTIPLDVQQMYILVNGTASSGHTLTFKYVSGSGSTVAWGTTDKGTKIVYATADHATNPNMVDTGIGSTGDHDLDGNEFILDADADTSITADTDDQIDIKIAGADDFQFTANTFTAQSGSTIAAQALTATTVTASGILKTDDTTAATSTTDGSLQTDGGLSVAADAIIGDDLKLLSDSAVLSFGADSDTTLTHTDGTGLTLNSTNKLLFRDTGLYINSSTDGQLDLVADTEIQIAATTIDINGAIAMDGAITGATNITLSGELDAATLDISGNADIDGTMEADAYTLEGSAFIKVAGTDFSNSLLVGHATTGTLDVASNNTGVGLLTLNALTSGDGNTVIGKGSGTAITTGGNNTGLGNNALYTVSTGAQNTGIGRDALKLTTGDFNIGIGYNAGDNITSGDGNVVIGRADVSSATGNDQLSISDGEDGSVVWMTGDSSANVTFAAEVAAATLDISGAIDIDGTANLDTVDIDGAVQIDGTVTVGVDDTGLDVKFFGASAGAYMEWDESADQLRIMGASADATTSTGKLLLATSLTDINANDVIGKIEFQAPHEAGGTDAITVAASIQALAQDTFSSSVNATDLIFYTGHSEANTEKFRFTSQGELGIGGANYGSDGQVLTSTGAGTAPAWEAVAGGLTGKVEGTNFTGSLLVGHSTTGTLNAAAQNTGVGLSGLDALTTGDNNTALGYESLTTNTTGSNNVGIGHDALKLNLDGNESTAIGSYALDSNTSGDRHVAVGDHALAANTTGNYSTAVGRSALEISTGDNNIALGYQAGDNITSGSGNVVIGKADVSSATGDDQLSISDGEDGSVVWLTGDSSGNVIHAGTTHSAGGQLTTTGKALVMGF